MCIFQQKLLSGLHGMPRPGSIMLLEDTDKTDYFSNNIKLTSFLNQ